MKLSFDTIEEKRLPNFKGGEQDFLTRMFVDEKNKIMLGCLEPGSTIGYHTHEADCEIVYILEGTATCLYDDVVETLLPGDCTYCPKGHSHSLQNRSDAPVRFFAVVPQQ